MQKKELPINDAEDRNLNVEDVLKIAKEDFQIKVSTEEAGEILKKSEMIFSVSKEMQRNVLPIIEIVRNKVEQLTSERFLPGEEKELKDLYFIARSYYKKLMPKEKFMPPIETKMMDRRGNMTSNTKEGDKKTKKYPTIKYYRKMISYLKYAAENFVLSPEEGIAGSKCFISIDYAGTMKEEVISKVNKEGYVCVKGKPGTYSPFSIRKNKAKKISTTSKRS